MAWTYPKTFGSETVQFDSEWNEDYVDSLRWVGADSHVGARGRAASLSITVDNLAYVEWDYTILDTGGMFTGNNFRLVAPTDGLYYAQASVKWASSPGVGTRRIELEKTGGVKIAETSVRAAPSGTGTTVSCSTMTPMTASQFIECRIEHKGTGSSLAISTDYLPFMSLTWIRALT